MATIQHAAGGATARPHPITYQPAEEGGGDACVDLRPPLAVWKYPAAGGSRAGVNG